MENDKKGGSVGLDIDSPKKSVEELRELAKQFSEREKEKESSDPIPEEFKNPEGEEQKFYQSRDGFEEVRILRGMYETMPLFETLDSAKAFICGGYARWMCSPRQEPVPPSDVDVYCFDKDTFDALRAALSATLTQKHENDVCVSFEKPKDSQHGYFSIPPVQLIKPMRHARVVTDGTMEEILKNFDFTVIRIGIQFFKETKTAIGLADADFIHDETGKILRLKNIHCPISSNYRVIKYCRRGYWIRPAQMLKLFLDWEQRDDAYRAKIVDYLTRSQSGQNLTQEEINDLEALMRID